MVAAALGRQCRVVSDGWYAWDLQLGPDNAEYSERLRIQVKNTAALHTWNVKQGTQSDCLFKLKYSNRPAYFEDNVQRIPCEKQGFLCDLFILCHHPIVDPETADHTDPHQWRFYLVPTIGPNVGISKDELKRLEIGFTARTKPRYLHRRPRSLENGIRGTEPVKPAAFRELNLKTISELVVGR